ncbi:hypothetical protein ACFXTH_034092 [Malus domestica]
MAYWHRPGGHDTATDLDLSRNFLSGLIPPNLCEGNKLQKLILFSNRFTDPLPKTLANCTSLFRLRIQNNQINGSVLIGFGLLPNLTFVDLSGNNFTSMIPENLGNAEALSYLNISLNLLHSVIPSNIWRAPNLQIFSASSSHLTGKIPDFIGCQSLYRIELQRNDFNGSIPWDIGHCEKLLNLNLSRNSLTGIIPWEISALPSITNLGPAQCRHQFLTVTISVSFSSSRAATIRLTRVTLTISSSRQSWSLNCRTNSSNLSSNDSRIFNCQSTKATAMGSQAGE